MKDDEIMTNKEAIEQLKWVQKRICEITYSPESFEAINLAIKAIEEKKRPQGKWIRKVDEVGFVSHICSKCGAEIEVEDCSDDKFCFNCGAEMKKGGEE